MKYKLIFNLNIKYGVNILLLHLLTKYFVLCRVKIFFSRRYGKAHVGVGKSVWKKIYSSKIPRKCCQVLSIKGKIYDSDNTKYLRSINPTINDSTAVEFCEM